MRGLTFSYSNLYCCYRRCCPKLLKFFGLRKFKKSCKIFVVSDERQKLHNVRKLIIFIIYNLNFGTAFSWPTWPGVAARWKNQNIVFLNVIETRLHSWWGAFDLSSKYNFTQTRIHIIFILSLQNSLKYNSYQQYNTKKCVSN